MIDKNDKPFRAYGPIEEAIRDEFWGNIENDEINQHLFTQHHWTWGDYYASQHYDLKSDYHRSDHEGANEEMEPHEHR